jgi:hypothetical protein
VKEGRGREDKYWFEFMFRTVLFPR